MSISIEAISQKATFEFKTLRAQALSKMIFPNEFFTPNFKSILQECLRHCSPNKIGVHEATWHNFVKFDRPFYMAEIVTAMNVIEGSTAHELGISLDEHLNILQNVVTPMAKKWSELDKEVSLPIKNKIETKYKTSGVPLGVKLIDYE